MQVFNNPYSNKPKQAWTLQKCFIYIPGVLDSKTQDNILAAAQGVSIRHSRSLRKRYPLTSGSPITLIGIPQGVCTLQTIIGPNHAVENFLQKFGSACNPFQLNVVTSAAAKNEPCQVQQIPNWITLNGCQGQQLDFTLSSQDNLIIAQGIFTIQFDDMDWSNI